MVLADDDEDVRPAEVINLGVEPAEFLTMVRQDADSTTFQIGLVFTGGKGRGSDEN